MNRPVDTVEAPPAEPQPVETPPAADPAGDDVRVEDVRPGEAAVARAARESLEGRARGVGRIWPFLGPAFIAAAPRT
jgi:hypothetical protein